MLKQIDTTIRKDRLHCTLCNGKAMKKSTYYKHHEAKHSTEKPNHAICIVNDCYYCKISCKYG